MDKNLCGMQTEFVEREVILLGVPRRCRVMKVRGEYLVSMQFIAASVKLG